jgi:hypothetical protein
LFLCSKECDVGAGIPADEAHRGSCAIVAGDRDVFVRFQRFIRRNDEARSPDDAARRAARAAMDRDEPWGNAVEKIGNLIRDCTERQAGRWGWHDAPLVRNDGLIVIAKASAVY